MQTGQEHQFREEARVERNVRNFVDEETVEYATLVCSDDDEDERLGYSRYKKGSGELKLSMVFDSLEAFKKAMVAYVLKNGWNVKYIRWDPDKYELKCASVAKEGEEECLWWIYCSYEEPLQKWMVKAYIKDHTCSKTGRSKLITQEIIVKLFVHGIRDNLTLKPKRILAEIQKRWGLAASIDQCRNAKKMALKIIQEELRNYRLQLLE